MNEQESAAWKAFTENSRDHWIEDEIYRLNGHGAFYFTGGESGIYMRIQKDGMLEAGKYEGAIPHIGDAMFRPLVTKPYADFSGAFTAAVEAAGKQFLVDMFSGRQDEAMRAAGLAFGRTRARAGMDKSIEVSIINAKDNERGGTLTLPATAGELRDLLERIGTGDDAYEIADIHANIDGISRYLRNNKGLDELNMAACFLKDMEDHELEKLKAVISSGLGDMPCNTGSLINILSADNFAAFELIEAMDAEELGRYREEEKPERFSFEEYGHMLEQAEHGVFTEYGYIYFKNKRIEPFYDGSIPEEYRISPFALQVSGNDEPPHRRQEEKPSILSQIHEAKKSAPAPHKGKSGRGGGEPEL
jgi:hypothetical protein